MKGNATKIENARPAAVFLDSSIWRKYWFDTNKSLLKEMFSCLAEGDAILLLPDVTKREILFLVREIISDTRSRHEKITQEVWLSKPWGSAANRQAMRQVDWDLAEKQADKVINKALHRNGIIHGS